jgi:NitT/TauT family transport system substrate-binding protein
MTFFRWSLGIAAAVGLACSFVLAPVPVAAQTDDALSIVAGNPAPGIFDTLELIAAGAGFYKQQHLDVTKNYGANPATAAQLVGSGRVDLAAIPVEPVIQGYDKGLRLQFIISRQVRYSYVLAVPVDSPIHTLGDFRGATLGETSASGAGEIAAASMLAGVGLKPSDYSFLPIGVGASALAQIQQKRVTGVAFPYLEVVNDSIAGNLQFRVFRHPLLKDVGNVGYAATPQTIATRPDVLKRFTRAIVEAALFVRTNPAAAAYLYVKGSGQKITPEALASTTRILTALEGDLPAADPSSKRIGYFPPLGVQLYSTILAQYGLAKAPIPGTTLVTNQFVPYANDFDHTALIAYAKAFRTQ